MFHIDRHIAVSAGWVAGPAFGLAMMAAPEYLHPSDVLAACLFWGGLGLFSLTLLIVLILSIREQDRRARTLGPLVVMAIGLAILGAGVAWYFWPSASSDATSSSAPTPPPAPITAPPAPEPQLPSNAKFKYRGKIYWATPKRYTKEEATDMRTALREIYDCINTKSSSIVSGWDGPAVMFTRDWLQIIQGEGPQSAIAKLDDVRSQVRSSYTELQEILNRRPYYRPDIMTIIDDHGESGDMNGTLNDYIGALKALPKDPNPDLIKLAIGPSEAKLESSINHYTNWIAAFNTKMMLIRDELDTLMQLE